MRAIEEVEEAIGVPPEVAIVRSAGFHLLLEHAGPVWQDVWADAAGIDVDVLGRMLERDDVRGRVRLSEEGQLLAIAGLSVEPTRHEIRIEGVTRWTWCALDAVGILGALEVDGSVESTSPLDDEQIRIGFVGGVPSTDAVMFIAKGYDGSGVVENWCPNINFFACQDDAHRWIDEAGLVGDVVAVSEIAARAAEMWRPVVEGP